MKNTSHQQNLLKKLSRRGAFTVIELVVVVLVIAILAAMLLPAINGARVTARNAQVTVDIKNIEAAIANFKLKYGREPPSSFLISPNSSDYQGTSAPPVGKNSLSIMRELWPEFNPLGVNNPAGRLGIGTAKYLNGADCLVFFLGGPGMYDDSNSPGRRENARPSGFSADPTDPFNRTGQNRVGPFLEFDSARLSDVNGNGFFELLDPLPNQTMPYQYLSSYEGRGYQPFGYDGIPENDDDEVIVKQDNQLLSPYIKRDSTWAAGTRPSTEMASDNWNGKSFQVISPGPDEKYGIGGEYDSEKGIATKSGSTDQYRSRENRAAESDNITNFSGGPLGLKFFNK